MLALLLDELRVLRVLQEFQVLHLPDLLVSSGDGLAVEVGPLVEVETGLNRQASSGRLKSCLACL